MRFFAKLIPCVVLVHTCGKYIRESLGLALENRSCGYFSPVAADPGEKRIIIEAKIEENTKSLIKSTFPFHALEKISQSDILNFFQNEKEIKLNLKVNPFPL